MRAVRIIAILVLVYAGLVVAFESLLGYYQPSSQGTIVITTTDADGETHDRVVSRLDSDGQLYVAANHWPRAWYNQALAEPNVSITSDGERSAYLAIPVSGEEHDRINRDNPVGLVGRILMGFPPRRFVRLESRPGDEAALAAWDASTSSGHVFTYSIIDTTSDTDGVLALLESTVLPAMVETGAEPYSVWLPVELPEDAPFAGLSGTQLALMLSWPEAGVSAEVLDAAITALDGVAAVHTRTLVPLYLAEGLHVPTGQGFYVHREERYEPADVGEAVRLSEEAWETWEPAWGTRVTGLYRERPDSSDQARLLRIVWYPSHQRWIETREFDRDPESRERFIARRQLQLEGSGIAIATNRAVE